MSSRSSQQITAGNINQAPSAANAPERGDLYLGCVAGRAGHGRRRIAAMWRCTWNRKTTTLDGFDTITFKPPSAVLRASGGSHG